MEEVESNRSFGQFCSSEATPVGKILSPRYRASPGVATEAPAGARSPKEPPTCMTVMTVHHHQNHHVAARSGVTVASGNNGLNLTRMSGLEAHRLENMVERNGVSVERLSNGLDARNNNHNNGLERGDHHHHHHHASSTTMPQRSRFMITDILGGASSKMHHQATLQNPQEPPASPPSTPRDLSVRHQSRTSLNNSNLDEDSDASHHDAASVTSNGKRLQSFASSNRVEELVVD